MRKSLLGALSVFFALTFITACQKETNDGLPGPAGPEGPAGPAGPAGPKGDSGVANVIYSDWIDVQFTQVVPQPGDTSYQAAIEAPKLTKDILDKGEIKVYVNFDTPTDPVVFPLPYFDGGLLINPAFVEGGIALLSNFNVSTFVDNNEKILQYRYVLIPGGVLARKPANVNLDNYSEAKKYLKIN